MLNVIKKILKSENRNIFLWSLLLTSLIPLMFALFFVSAISKSSLEKQILENLASIADKKATEIEKQIQNTQNIAYLASQSPLLTGSLNKILQMNEDKLKLSESNYKQIISELRSYFSDLQNLYKYTDIYLFTDKGELIISLSSPEQEKLQKREDLLTGELGRLFQSAITLQESQISSLVYSDQFTKPQIYIASPVIEKGATRGVLILQMDTDFIEKTVQDYSGLGNSGETLVGEIKGNFIEPSIGLRHSDIVGFMASAKNMDSRMVATFKAATSGGRSSGMMQDYRKKEVLGFARYIPSMNWGMLVKVDMDEAFIPVVKMRRNMIILGSLSLFGIFLLAYIISDRLQKAQDKLNRLLTELELANRAVTKANVELEAANREIQHANHAKSQFLSNMSHELRTPLNAVIGYSEMLAEELEEKGWKEYLPDLNKINLAGKHLLSLINNVLDISKIEAGKMVFFLSEINLKKLLSEIESMVIPLAQKKRNQFVLNCNSKVDMMQTDATKLKQCLLNLIGNACKFTTKGTVSLTVTSFEKNGKEWIKFEVKDTGIGISEENLNRLFKAFSQVISADSQGGTGLGLYLTLQFTRLLGGEVTALSTEGKGSTFSMILPAIYQSEKSELEEQKIVVQDKLVPIEIKSQKYKKKILIIDDEKEAHEAITPELQAADFDIIQAFNGESGFLMAQKHHPDLILLDVVLPDIDGWQVLSQLKADEKLKLIPVIMLTQLTSEKFAFSRGVADYLVKPVGGKELVENIKKTIALKKINYILVVDDDEALRQLFCSVLHKTGWKVKEAANGREAIEIIQQEIPSLILLDILMPEVNGFEVIEKLQINPLWNEIPIIILTSATLTKEELERLEHASLRVFQKSNYRKGDLLEEIREILL